MPRKRVKVRVKRKTGKNTKNVQPKFKTLEEYLEYYDGPTQLAPPPYVYNGRYYQKKH